MRSRLIFLLVALAACGGDDVTPDAGGGADAAIGDPEVLVGRFEIELVAASESAAARTQVIGEVYDAPPPSLVVWEVMTTDGECELLKPRVPFCNTPCSGGDVCVENDTCQAYAEKQPVGTVHVSGLALVGGGDEFTMDPIANTYQPTADVMLAYPPFAAGDAIALSADGSSFTGAFMIEATGIAPLALTNPDPELMPDQPIELAWTAAAGGTSTIAVKLDISHHGGTTGKIECLAPDTGTLSISGTLVTQLLALGAAGFPTIIVVRSTVGQTVIPAGRVDLEVRSKVERPVTVPGVRSCTDETDCNPGEICRDDLTCG